jgi:hypothetical protein
MSNSGDFAAQLEAARKRSAGALTFRPEIEGECTRVPAEQDATPARVPNASANAGERAGQVIDQRYGGYERGRQSYVRLSGCTVIRRGDTSRER